MTRIPLQTPGTVNQRLVEEADRRGDADGVATPRELRALARALTREPAAKFDEAAADRTHAARALAASTLSWASLDPALVKLPDGVKRLALELDGLWGNADGKVSAAEVDRVARYYLAALPYFTKASAALLELARHLGLDDAAAAKSAQGVVALRVALARVDRAAVDDAQPFRALFDKAVAEADIPGAPGLLRDAAAHSPRWHRLSILEHTALAVASAPPLAKAAGVDWKDAGGALLLHDVGKILDRQVVQEDGGKRFNFWGHEGAGAQWLQAHQVSPEVVFLVHNHAVLRDKTADEMFALDGADRGRLAKLMVMYVADQVAKGDTPDQLASMAHQTPKILELCQRLGVDGPALLRRADALRAEHFPRG